MLIGLAIDLRHYPLPPHGKKKKTSYRPLHVTRRSLDCQTRHGTLVLCSRGRVGDCWLCWSVSHHNSQSNDRDGRQMRRKKRVHGDKMHPCINLHRGGGVSVSGRAFLFSLLSNFIHPSFRLGYRFVG